MDQTSQPPNALTAEHDALASQDLSILIGRNGFQVADPFASNAEASAWIDERTPAVAILDSNLVDGLNDDLALALRRRGVLVLVHDEVSGLRRCAQGHAN